MKKATWQHWAVHAVRVEVVQQDGAVQSRAKNVYSYKSEIHRDRENLLGRRGKEKLQLASSANPAQEISWRRWQWKY